MARITIKVLFVVCNNVGLPDSEGMTDIRVGCKAHFDLNAKDANNRPTSPERLPVWTFENPRIIEIHEDPWTPFIKVNAPGHCGVWAEADGVKSNVLELRFYE